jgi:hypothetical protein
MPLSKARTTPAAAPLPTSTKRPTPSETAASFCSILLNSRPTVCPAASTVGRSFSTSAHCYITLPPIEMVAKCLQSVSRRATNCRTARSAEGYKLKVKYLHSPEASAGHSNS